MSCHRCPICQIEYNFLRNSNHCLVCGEKLEYIGD